MARFLSVLLWTAVFLLLLIGIDQLLVRVPASLPAHIAVATFYRDLRSRAVDLAKGSKVPPPPTPAKPAPAKVTGKVTGKTTPGSVEALIEQRQSRPAIPPPAPPTGAKPPLRQPAPRYVYADDRGEIQFADTLAEVPEPFRDKARKLGE